MARRPPSTRADPACGLISPASTLRRVVLPAPLGPKIASVCPGARLNETPSSATTRPNAWRNPSAKSINAGGQVFQVERLDEVSRVAEVQHVDQRLHADVGGGDDDGERGAGAGGGGGRGGPQPRRGRRRAAGAGRGAPPGPRTPVGAGGPPADSRRPPGRDAAGTRDCRRVGAPIHHQNKKLPKSSHGS